MTEQASNGAAQGEQNPQFSLQRIYVRDLSFEAPKSPEIFRQEWAPSVAMDLNTRQKALDGDFHDAPFPQQGKPHILPGRDGGNAAHQIAVIADARPIHRGDDIALAQP